ncbi:MAG: hypothetical protein RSC87_10055 [Muribaculaceae bacterium]
MYKLKDIAEIQTGIYAKASPNPDTVYLQVNNFDAERVICNTAKPSITIPSKNKGHYLNVGDLLFAAKGNNNFVPFLPDMMKNASRRHHFWLYELQESTLSSHNM